MLLLLMRHGIAEELREGQADAARELTQIGEKKTRAALRGLKFFQNEIDFIACSPLVRAVQTAQIAEQVFEDGQPQIWPELEDAEYYALTQRLKSLDASAALLVGHEPGISQFVTRALSGENSGFEIQFKKAAVCALDVDWSTPRPRATLLWHASPKMLRLMVPMRAPKPEL